MPGVANRKLTKESIEELLQSIRIALETMPSNPAPMENVAYLFAMEAFGAWCIHAGVEPKSELVTIMTESVLEAFSQCRTDPEFSDLFIVK